MIKCLIIDDDEIHREVAEHYALSKGLEVKMAVDGEWGLISCKREMPDIIILDWMMPNMNGVEFLKALQEVDSPKPPYVIMCTAKGESSHSANNYLAGQSIQMGSMDFLPKPFYAEQLIEKIDNALDYLNS